MTNERPAAGAERQAVVAIVLLHSRRHAVDRRGRARRRTADRGPADHARRREIALDERRRHLQHARDVVEAVARIVGRQQVGDIDLDRRAGRARRCCTRSGSADGRSRCGLDWAAARRRRRGRPGASRGSAGRWLRRAAGCPAGGIRPLRSLRTTFSQSSGLSATAATSTPASTRSPACIRVLWQPCSSG